MSPDALNAVWFFAATVLLLLLALVSLVAKFRFRADITTKRGRERTRRRRIRCLEVRRTRSNTYYRPTTISSSQTRSVGLFGPEPSSTGLNVLSDMLHIHGLRGASEVYLWSYRFSEATRAELLLAVEAYNRATPTPCGPKVARALDPVVAQ